MDDGVLHCLEAVLLRDVVLRVRKLIKAMHRVVLVALDAVLRHFTELIRWLLFDERLRVNCLLDLLLVKLRRLSVHAVGLLHLNVELGLAAAHRSERPDESGLPQEAQFH